MGIKNVFYNGYISTSTGFTFNAPQDTGYAHKNGNLWVNSTYFTLSTTDYITSRVPTNLSTRLWSIPTKDTGIGEIDSISQFRALSFNETGFTIASSGGDYLSLAGATPFSFYHDRYALFIQIGSSTDTLYISLAGALLS